MNRNISRLFAMLEKESAETISAALKESGGPNIRNGHGRTPLMIAVLHERRDLLEMLVKAGVDVNAVDYQKTSALIMAVKFGLPSIVEKLLELGGDARVSDEDGVTALMHSTRIGLSGMMRSLLPHSDPKATDDQGNTALIWASWGANPDHLEILISRSDVMTRNKAGESALDIAERYGYESCSTVLRRAVLAHEERDVLDSETGNGRQGVKRKI